MLPWQSNPMGIQPKASSSPGPPPMSPLATMRKKTKTTARARRGSSSPTWAKIPYFTVDRDLPDHSSYDPSAPTVLRLTERGPTPYRVSPDGVLLRILPRPTPFSVMPSPSNERCNLVFFTNMFLILSAN
ncbi:hypothetical protein BHE74_00058943 [Ensete ventricosum]|nr:hypothetical protein GW17_00030646 [Ensete ventricosum]RWW36067.1 hypothetical protein BHE74_00058943 [Ensete ventricosum]